MAVPIAPESIRDNYIEEDLKKYDEYFKKGKVERVFVAALAPMYSKKIDESLESYKFKRTVEFFKEQGMEVGIWISGFGHGGALVHDSFIDKKEITGK